MKQGISAAAAPFPRLSAPLQPVILSGPVPFLPHMLSIIREGAFGFACLLDIYHCFLNISWQAGLYTRRVSTSRLHRLPAVLRCIPDMVACLSIISIAELIKNSVVNPLSCRADDRAASIGISTLR